MYVEKCGITMSAMSPIKEKDTIWNVFYMNHLWKLNVVFNIFNINRKVVVSFL